MNSGLHWIDYIIVFLSVVAAIWIGLHFARRQKTTSGFFTASESHIPAWAIGISIFATLISSVTFLSYPEAGYNGNWILLVQGLMVPIVLVGMIGFIVPLYRRVIKISAYEYFERRFGLLARVYSSLAFVFTNFSKMGTIFFLLSVAIASFFGIHATNPNYVTLLCIFIAVLGLTIVILTMLGGLEAVIWMDVLQGFLLIAGGLVCVGLLLFLPEGGPSYVISTAFTEKKISLGPYYWSLKDLTFWVMVINGIFYAVQKYGTDQAIVQRYLTAKDDRSAKKASFLGIGLSVPVWTLFMFIGSCLWVYFHQTPALSAEVAQMNTSEVFPYFISTRIPVGMAGLVVAALVAAAISSLDSDMNCIAAIGVQDYYARFKPKSTDKQRLRVGRLIILISGVCSIGVGMLYAFWGGQGILGTLFGLYAIFSAGIVGLFLLGLFSRRANKQGLYVGLACAVLFTAWAMLTSPMNVAGEKKIILDLGAWNYTHHTYMLGVYSHIIVFVVGWLASFLFKSEPAPDNLTIYGYLAERRAEKAAKKAANE